MIGVCHSIVEIMQLKGKKVMDILQTRQQRNILFGGSITRPLVRFDPLSYVILSTSMRRGWGGVFHVITEFVMMLVVGLVEGCLSLSEMEPLTVRSPLILPCIVV